MRLQLIPSVHRATHRIALYLEAAEPPLGVSQGEAHLLAHLHESGPSAIRELHEAFAHKRSSLTTYLDRLQAHGLITRALHPGDRRSFVVSLTRKGGGVAARVHRHFEVLEDAALRSLGERDVRAFQAVLHALQERAESMPKKKGSSR